MVISDCRRIVIMTTISTNTIMTTITTSTILIPNDFRSACLQQ